MGLTRILNFLWNWKTFMDYSKHVKFYFNNSRPGMVFGIRIGISQIVFRCSILNSNHFFFPSIMMLSFQIFYFDLNFHLMSMYLNLFHCVLRSHIVAEGVQVVSKLPFGMAKMCAKVCRCVIGGSYSYLIKSSFCQNSGKSSPCKT